MRRTCTESWILGVPFSKGLSLREGGGVVGFGCPGPIPRIQ